MINKKINSLRNNYIYARVSSNNQKDDLTRQINVLKLKYPNYKLISDIRSDINLDRKDLIKIIDEAILGKINEVIIVHKDRLCKN
jgi:predicted site-specific integrase-resolvase